MLLLRDFAFFLFSASVGPAPRSTVALSLSIALVDRRVRRVAVGRMLSSAIVESNGYREADSKFGTMRSYAGMTRAVRNLRRQECKEVRGTKVGSVARAWKVSTQVNIERRACPHAAPYLLAGVYAWVTRDECMSPATHSHTCGHAQKYGA